MHPEPGSGVVAFGTLQSGSLVPVIGAQLRNDTALALSEIAVAYTGEQWRLGVAGRSDRLDFQYSLDAGAGYEDREDEPIRSPSHRGTSHRATPPPLTALLAP